MIKLSLTIAAVAALTGGTLAATPAEARVRGHSVSIQGAHGHGAVRSRSISRQPGAVAASRSLQTNGGYGYRHSRSASWNDGAYASSRGTTFNNGLSRGRTTSAVRNGDGTASYATTRTRLDGSSRTVTGTVGGNR